MNNMFKPKILLVAVAAAGLFLETCKFSDVCCAERLPQGREPYNDTLVADMLEREDADELRNFWFQTIDADDVALLDRFFTRLDYGDQNYFFYLPDDSGMSALERAIYVGSINVAGYLYGLQHR